MRERDTETQTERERERGAINKQLKHQRRARRGNIKDELRESIEHVLHYTHKHTQTRGKLTLSVLERNHLKTPDFSLKHETQTHRQTEKEL